jgi:CRP-like cAMP-binding protein
MTAWLSTFSDNAVTRIRSVGTTQKLSDGEIFIHEGEVDERLFLIEEGKVEVISKDKHRAFIDSGDIVGEFAFLDRRPRTATVRASGDAKVCVLERQNLMRALADNPDDLVSFINAVSLRMRTRLDGTSGTDPNEDVEEFLRNLAHEAINHRAVKHRYLKALADGSFPDLRWALADFGRQYFGYSAHFPRYLTTVISRLELPQHRAALLENLTEESGVYGAEELEELAEFGIKAEWIVGIPHPKLFQRFRIALGVADSAIEEDPMEVVCWREMFLSVLGGSPAEAVGALGLGTEGVVRDMYESFVIALKRVTDLDPRDVVFFPLHTAVDDHHQATLLDIARYYAQTPQSRRELAKGMRKALALRASFWDWMYERAMEGPAAASA